MAVRARIVGVAFVAAFIASLEMAAENCGAAAFDGTQHTFLADGQRRSVLLAKLVAVRAHDIGYFQGGPHEWMGGLRLRIQDRVRE
jgi:hypothetical protein